jgi:uncharacterized membrane protein
MNSHKVCSCAVCKKSFALNLVSPISLVRESILNLIKEKNPQITNDEFICFDDLNAYRKKYFESMVQDEKGDLDDIKASILTALQERETISKNVNDEDYSSLTFGERLSDKIASFGGSWPFLILFGVALAIWITYNVITVARFDPYPFILLNLILSCVAAVQAPVIMMSQNRQSTRDRKRQEEDYKVNLKVEIDIRMLNEKVDKLISHQWQRLIKIQELQMEMMEEMHREQIK